MAYDFRNIQKCINHCLESTQRLNVHGPLEPGISNTYHQLGEEIADSRRTESPGQNKQLWSCGLHAMLFHCASCCSISIPHLGIKMVSPLIYNWITTTEQRSWTRTFSKWQKSPKFIILCWNTFSWDWEIAGTVYIIWTWDILLFHSTPPVMSSICLWPSWELICWQSNKILMTEQATLPNCSANCWSWEVTPLK